MMNLIYSCLDSTLKIYCAANHVHSCEQERKETQEDLSSYKNGEMENKRITCIHHCMLPIQRKCHATGIRFIVFAFLYSWPSWKVELGNKSVIRWTWNWQMHGYDLCSSASDTTPLASNNSYTSTHTLSTLSTNSLTSCELHEWIWTSNSYSRIAKSPHNHDALSKPMLC